MPPVLLMHGERDGVVPCQHSVLMYERIRAVCGEGRAKLLLYPERVHSDRDFMAPESAELAADFFGRVFRGAAPFD
jgi:dipeptidyl aminopeptidase/acylaminoacyl peptidase